MRLIYLKHVSLALLSGILLAFSWPAIGDAEYLIFVALIPLLSVEHEILRKNLRKMTLTVFLMAYIAFLSFNVITTWWIKLASPGGMILAVTLNALFMSLVFLIFHLTRKYVNNKVGYIALIVYWIGFEWLHINWELSWIWLNLGNVFANRIEWIQWYEHTGTMGGTLWIMAVNVLIFKSHLQLRFGYRGITRQLIQFAMILFALCTPFIYSNWLFENYTEKIDPVEVVVVQPNIDPYKDKFNGMHEYEQIDRLINVSEKFVTKNTEVIFGPETAFPMGYWEHEIEVIYGTDKTLEFISKFPNLKYVVGLSTIRLYVKGEPHSNTARTFNDGSGNYFDYYNTAIQIEKTGKYTLYRKSKLVLGVEKMPFTSSFSLLEKLSIKLGGASGSLGVEGTPVLFESTTSDGRELKIVPAICYESIYGEYLTEFVMKGGNLLGIITNDGWWANTPGYAQHLAYSRLRAIELRRSIARSANTGISALINQKGEIFKKTEWWKETGLIGNLNLNSSLTFYAKHGDYLGRISAFFSVLLCGWLLVRFLRRDSKI